MYSRQYVTSILLFTLLTACDSSSTKSSGGASTETQSLTTPTKETIDNDFYDFIEKFSADSTFQLSRTKFPLKTKWYDMDNDSDSIIYKDRSKFELMDFRKKKSTGQYDLWEQKVVIGKDNASVTIEIRGVENGIMVDYLFEKINGAWMLIEIDDSST